MAAIRPIIQFECQKCSKFYPSFFFNDGSENCSECEDDAHIAAAKLEFYNHVSKFGGIILSKYENSKSAIKCRCKNGHDCYFSPYNIRRGRRMCNICPGKNSSATAEANFRKRISELGGKVLGKYQGNRIAIKCQCRNGHECSPMPTSIQQGQGMCKICAGICPTVGEANFRSRISLLGGKILGQYRGSRVKVKCECKNGHECNVRPGTALYWGICMICVNHDFSVSETNFRKRITEFGGKVLGEYQGNRIPVKCECKEGHECSPMPMSIQQGQGMCKICSGHDSATAELNFKRRIAELGGKVLGQYQGNKFRVKCECKEGHECNPFPKSVQQKEGMCSSCKFKSESLCRKIFEDLLGCSMYKIKPPWLMWNNGISLELDGYNEEKRIAFEYQGIQHSEYNSYFHRNGPIDFELQQERDIFKARTCLEKGVTLICIHHNYTHKDPESMEKYIRSELIRHDIIK